MSDFIYWETERIYAKYKTRDPFKLLDAMGARVIFTYVPPHLFAFKLYSIMRRGYEVRSPIDLDSKFLGK